MNVTSGIPLTQIVVATTNPAANPFGPSTCWGNSNTIPGIVWSLVDRIGNSIVFDHIHIDRYIVE